jgi:transcriptional regulator of acetoin/glycerol metabolism
MVQRPTPAPTQASASRALVDAQHAQLIAASHERCQAFGLSEHSTPDLRRLKPAGLHDVQQRNARLCAQALPVMDMLYEQLTHAQSMVLLTDASGCVLHALGDAGFLERAQQVALTPGALWAEADKGTNAVGTALMTESATLVHGQEHYLRAMQFLTCSAAPIFDHKGALLGVIDVSGERRSYHPHTLALATMSARLIESQWFADRFRHSTRLHLHSNPMGLGTLHEAQLALDEDGRILGVNRRAIDMLGLSATALRRESLEHLFGCSLGALAQLTRAEPDRPQRLSHGARPGEALYAKLSLPMGGLDLQRAQTRRELHEQPTPSPPPPALGAAPAASAAATALAAKTPPSLRQTELHAIAAAVEAAGGNLSAAARQLGIGRSTLYRKLRALG